MRFMVLDAGNPSSIFCCLRAARESARSVRGAITSEMYEDLNGAWIEMRELRLRRACRAMGVSEFLDWVKMRSHLFRGVTFGTMLRDEAYHFIRLGTHLERADNTARILDTKYHILLPSARRRRRRRRLLPVGVAAAVGVGLRVVPQDLQRRDHAAPGRRAPGAARRHAALAAQLPQLHRRHARAHLRRPQPRRCAGRPASCTRGCTSGAPTTSSASVCTNTSWISCSGSRCSATKSAEHFLVPSY